LEGVVYRPLVRPTAHVDLAIAHRTDRTEPHLSRAVSLIRQIV
jgi:hypothetical protein